MFSGSPPLPFSAHDAIILRPQPLGKALARFRHPRCLLRLLADVLIVVCTPLPGLLPGLQLALLNLSRARPLSHSLPVLLGRFDKIALGRLHLGRSRPIRSRRRPAQALLILQRRRQRPGRRGTRQARSSRQIRTRRHRFHNRGPRTANWCSLRTGPDHHCLSLAACDPCDEGHEEDDGRLSPRSLHL